MFGQVKKHKLAFSLSCCFILVAARSAERFMVTGSLIYQRWASPDGTGLVMTGWQAVGVILGEAAIGLYGLFLVVRTSRSRTGPGDGSR